mmetsp:Transcript_53331/g.88713  ORF Transcript_53331/g.88713 Transcript_53331/m.88713 type:complete len:98 (+) Transcript_53331:275-568(+)
MHDPILWTHLIIIEACTPFFQGLQQPQHGTLVSHTCMMWELESGFVAAACESTWGQCCPRWVPPWPLHPAVWTGTQWVALGLLRKVKALGEAQLGAH